MENKKIIYQIIDNKINILDLSKYYFKNDNDFKLISNSIKLNKSIRQIMLNSSNILDLKLLNFILKNNNLIETLYFNKTNQDIILLVNILKIADIFKKYNNLKTLLVKTNNIKNVNYILKSFKQKNILITFTIKNNSNNNFLIEINRKIL